MPRRPNYDFEKRRKEQERKAKKDAKRADRQRRHRGATDDEQVDPTPPAVPEERTPPA